ncbi:MAG: hypothetical protein C0500_14390 [Sphingobium sp.]|nr:hypothetical protein [Sphingobium sp.]
MAPSVAYAACSQWRVGGNVVSFQQSDGSATQLNLGRRGTRLYGTAEYGRWTVGRAFIIGSKARKITMTGNIDGEFSNNRLDFKISWSNGSTGMYDLRIDDAGRLSGETYDFNNPSHRARITGFDRMTCARP